MAPPRASFTTKRISQTTFVIQEHDAYGEHPLIYVKISPRANVIVLSDTGCNAPSDEHLNDRYTNLRRYLGHYPVTDNNGKPLNSQSSRKYIIICSHCHFDHTLGIPSFVEDGQTADIVASAAGRDFIESDLDTHGLFKYIGKPAPKYTVTKWAQAFERLTYPFHATPDHDGEVDLGITVLHTPGHTPDELAWYDHDEMHLYVGDSFYREGEDGMPIVFPKEGSMIEWVFSMQKLAVFVRAENARAADDATSGPDASDAEDEQEEGPDLCGRWS
ncbi:hypothetical protein BAUCODRAFT_30232 [Baudoinia panamericana UAMH 10762]|uniref:Metallo-beta-lactamase domain-containing protein n=1 Tax=Baudoinia panamericana (strain UAMH 10762) TaxID=717646 RepID=M2LYN5_BAUPA|nr:uncharacterized protein BAUCODRAFT_30232 [Baudoinia panamericana UAMH 10762]EMC99817.1 hypothetical protein BAUCODRAFT_30232 [Baudoinia panamericana UAMH 10762]